MAMSNSNDVNLVCNNIHELIHSSGLHYIINQTPWSSYITIRRKFREPLGAFLVKSDVGMPDELLALHQDKKLLSNKVKNLEKDLVDTEEELKATEHRSKERVENLHGKINDLELSCAAVQENLEKSETVIRELENDIVMKDDIINSLNTGFNKQTVNLKVKIEELESFKKEALKKEKKVKKKLRQKLNKKQEYHAYNDLVADEDNNSITSTSEINQTLKATSYNDSTSALTLVSSCIDKTTTTSQVSLSLNATSLFSPLTALTPPSGESSTLGTAVSPPESPPPCRTADTSGTAVPSASALQSQQKFKNEILRRLYGRRS